MDFAKAPPLSREPLPENAPQPMLDGADRELERLPCRELEIIARPPTPEHFGHDMVPVDQLHPAQRGEVALVLARLAVVKDARGADVGELPRPPDTHRQRYILHHRI